MGFWKSLSRLPEAVSKNTTLDRIIYAIFLIGSGWTVFMFSSKVMDLWASWWMMIFPFLSVVLAYISFTFALNSRVGYSTAFIVFTYPIIVLQLALMIYFPSQYDFNGPQDNILSTFTLVYYAFLLFSSRHEWLDFCHQCLQQIVRGILLLLGGGAVLVLGYVLREIFLKGFNRVFYRFGEDEFMLLFVVVSLILSLLIWIHISFRPSLSWDQEKRNRFFAWLRNTIIALVLIGGLYLAYDHYLTRVMKQVYELPKKESISKEDYKKLPSKFFIKKAYKKQIKENIKRKRTLLTSFQEEKFSMIFDEHPYVYFKDKLKKHNLISDTTNATNITDDGAVNLTLVEYETTFDPEYNIAETTAEYAFENTHNELEEVIIEFALPGKNSVITDLQLGLHLEHQGIIASRGAAEKVYQDSLRKRRDPALIQQIGANLYRLRVYPIPRASDSKFHGKQKVAFSFAYEPDPNDDGYSLAPRLKLYNLETEYTDLKIRAYQDDELLFEKKTGKIDKDFLLSEYRNQIPEISKPEKEATDQCVHPELEIFATDLSTEKDIKRMVVFLDNSISAGKNGFKKTYQTLVPQIQDYATKQRMPLDLYSYNFDVTEIGGIEDLEFWGYTDSSKLIDYVLMDSFSNTLMIIVTDDSRFEGMPNTAKSLDYTKTLSNQIEVLQIGEDLKSYPDAINFSLFATGGGVRVSDKNAHLDFVSSWLENLGSTEVKSEVCASVDTEKNTTSSPDFAKDLLSEMSFPYLTYEGDILQRKKDEIIILKHPKFQVPLEKLTPPESDHFILQKNEEQYLELLKKMLERTLRKHKNETYEYGPIQVPYSEIYIDDKELSLGNTSLFIYVQGKVQPEIWRISNKIIRAHQDPLSKGVIDIAQNKIKNSPQNLIEDGPFVISYADIQISSREITLNTQNNNVLRLRRGVNDNSFPGAHIGYDGYIEKLLFYSFDKQAIETREAYKPRVEIKNPSQTDKLKGAQIARLLSQNITDSQRPGPIAETQGAISEALGIVTPYATYIALVEDWQRQNLERYEQQGDRYNQKYDTLSGNNLRATKSFPPRGTRSRGPLIAPDDSPSAVVSNRSRSRGGLISADDCPSGVCTNTSFGGSSNQALLTLKNYIAFGGAIVVALILVFRLLFRRSK